VINPWPPKEPDSGLQIKGVQRHLELQRLAKQMKIDQAEWEKKVFFSHVSLEAELHVVKLHFLKETWCDLHGLILFLILWPVCWTFDSKTMNDPNSSTQYRNRLTSTQGAATITALAPL
jgi:hypothetical protein